MQKGEEGEDPRSFPLMLSQGGIGLHLGLIIFCLSGLSKVMHREFTESKELNLDILSLNWRPLDAWVEDKTYNGVRGTFGVWTWPFDVEWAESPIPKRQVPPLQQLFRKSH